MIFHHSTREDILAFVDLHFFDDYGLQKKGRVDEGGDKVELVELRPLLLDCC